MRTVVIAMTIAASAAAAAPDLASLPPPAGAAADAGSAEAKALDAAVGDYARGTFTVAEARHFALEQKLGWQQVLKPVANEIASAGGTRVPIEWNRPGYDLIELFRMKDGSGIVVAMEHREPPQQPRVAGYYRVVLKDGAAR